MVQGRPKRNHDSRWFSLPAQHLDRGRTRYEGTCPYSIIVTSRLKKDVVHHVLQPLPHQMAGANPSDLVQDDPTANKPDNSAIIAELSQKFAALKIFASSTAQATEPKDADQGELAAAVAAEPFASNDGEVEKVGYGPLPCHMEACSMPPSPIPPPDDHSMDVDEEWESSSRSSVFDDDCAMDIDWSLGDEDVEMADGTDCTDCCDLCHCQ